MRGRKMFLVRLDRDVRIQKIVKRPVEMMFFDEDGSIDVELVEKTAILCDLCNSQVAVEESELDSLPAGYCRKRYLPRLKIYSNLEEVDKAGER